MKAQLNSAFVETEAQFVEFAKKKNDQSGTTGTVALIRGTELVVGHVGDSRALLCTQGLAVPLTTDHHPNIPAEKNRIQTLGGFVKDDRCGFLPKCLLSFCVL